MRVNDGNIGGVRKSKLVKRQGNGRPGEEKERKGRGGAVVCSPSGLVCLVSLVLVSLDSSGYLLLLLGPMAVCSWTVYPDRQPQSGRGRGWFIQSGALVLSGWMLHVDPWRQVWGGFEGGSRV